MSLNLARINLFNYIRSNRIETPILFQGQKITDSYIKRQTPWMYMTVSWGGHNQESHPAPQVYYSTTGVLGVKLYVRDASGIGVTDQITDELFDLFRMLQVENVTMSDINILADEQSRGWNIRHITFSFILRTFENIS